MSHSGSLTRRVNAHSRRAFRLAGRHACLLGQLIRPLLCGRSSRSSSAGVRPEAPLRKVAESPLPRDSRFEGGQVARSARGAYEDGCLEYPSAAGPLRKTISVGPSWKVLPLSPSWKVLPLSPSWKAVYFSPSWKVVSLSSPSNRRTSRAWIQQSQSREVDRGCIRAHFALRSRTYQDSICRIS